MSRRDLLKRGAVVGVAAAWTIPLVQVVSMTPAHADSPSAPPVGPPTNNPPPPPLTSVPTDPGSPSKSSSGTNPSSASKSNSTVVDGSNQVTAKPALAFTGSNTMPALGIGAAAVALGVGAVAASQVGKSKADKPADQLD
ncbi:MAG: twin-arginine translocation signal domain-containing protein [Actinomycetota bacterium]|nr:twin-arginine translocation signal domain-containing protein [Actinomycetota bacterium]MDQ2957771.1 twin-arginine translocation signal domain-containing protein [Actinomycetota bacterium]